MRSCYIMQSQPIRGYCLQQLTKIHSQFHMLFNSHESSHYETIFHGRYKKHSHLAALYAKIKDNYCTLNATLTVGEEAHATKMSMADFIKSYDAILLPSLKARQASLELLLSRAHAEQAVLYKRLESAKVDLDRYRSAHARDMEITKSLILEMGLVSSGAPLGYLALMERKFAQTCREKTLSYDSAHKLFVAESARWEEISQKGHVPLMIAFVHLRADVRRIIKVVIDGDGMPNELKVCLKLDRKYNIRVFKPIADQLFMLKREFQAEFVQKSMFRATMKDTEAKRSAWLLKKMDAVDKIRCLAMERDIAEYQAFKTHMQELQRLSYSTTPPRVMEMTRLQTLKGAVDDRIYEADAEITRLTSIVRDLHNQLAALSHVDSRSSLHVPTPAENFDNFYPKELFDAIQYIVTSFRMIQQHIQDLLVGLRTLGESDKNLMRCLEELNENLYRFVSNFEYSAARWSGPHYY